MCNCWFVLLYGRKPTLQSNFPPITVCCSTMMCWFLLYNNTSAEWPLPDWAARFLLWLPSRLPAACPWAMLDWALSDTQPGRPLGKVPSLYLPSSDLLNQSVHIHTSLLVVIVNLFPFGLLWHWFTDLPSRWFTGCLLSELPGGRPVLLLPKYAPPLLQPYPWEAPLTLPDLDPGSFQIRRWSSWGGLHGYHC